MAKHMDSPPFFLVYHGNRTIQVHPYSIKLYIVVILTGDKMLEYMISSLFLHGADWLYCLGSKLGLLPVWPVRVWVQFIR